jgi:nicotinate-nucleotide adenylyltransferase
MSKIGIFGGTFDPPHIVHLILAAEAQYQLALDRVLWVLSPEPPHKRGRIITAWQTRMQLLEAAIGADPGFVISRVEINRPPPHFAFETVQLIKQEYPDDALVYLMGGDELRDLASWKQPADFIAACDAIGVMRRPADAVDLLTLERELPGLTEKVWFLAAPLIEISASEIRRRIDASQPVRYFLPSPVFKLILERKLYQET